MSATYSQMIQKKVYTCVGNVCLNIRLSVCQQRKRMIKQMWQNINNCGI